MSEKNDATLLRTWQSARRRLARFSVLTGFAFALTKTLEILALVALTGWSYSVWGNDLSPLGSLLLPGLWLIASAVILRGLGWLFLFRTTHWHRAELALRRAMKPAC